MKNNWSVVAMGLAMIGVVGFLIWWEVQLWTECRELHSWFYCVRTLGSK